MASVIYDECDRTSLQLRNQRMYGLGHKFCCLEIICFLLQEQGYYSIWYSDETKDGFLTNNYDLITFTSEKTASEFVRFHTSYYKPVTTTIYRMETVKQMIDQQRPFDACVMLEFWNIVGDLADSIKAPFCGNLQDDLTNEIYEKLFYGNNLPEINTSGQNYMPQFTDEEWRKLKEILLEAFSVITNAFKDRDMKAI